MNIFVAKLSSKTKGEDLQRLFSKFGEVTSSKVIIDKQTGFSKRYGFVEMPDEREGYEAIEKLNNTELDGSRIVVKLSVPSAQQQERPKHRSHRTEEK